MSPLKNTYHCNECNKDVLKGQYCTTCGLYNFGEKATVGIFIKNALSQVLSLERGLFFNFKIALTNPKQLVWTYFEGIRRKYASHGGFVLYTLFLMGLFYLIFPGSAFFNLTIQDESAESITTNKFFLVIIIPLLTISSKLTFWRKVPGIAAHLISMVYVILPRFIITSIILIIGREFVDHDLLYQLLVLGLLFWIFWSNTNVFLTSPSFIQKLGFALLQFVILCGILLVILSIFILLDSASFEYKVK